MKVTTVESSMINASVLSYTLFSTYNAQYLFPGDCGPGDSNQGAPDPVLQREPKAEAQGWLLHIVSICCMYTVSRK